MRAAFFWEPEKGLSLDDRCNPYGPLLKQALARRGIELELGDYDLSAAWLEAQRRHLQVLHLNWLHHFYRRDTLEHSVEAYARFAENLTLARSLGYRIIWTLHNHYPHERPFPHLDRMGRLLVGRLAHAVMAHCQYAADLARGRFHCAGTVRVIPHGHFIDAFPNQTTRQAARQKLDLPQDAFAYLFFGNARGYKGVERLIESFCAAAGNDALLLLMLRRTDFDPQYVDSLMRLASGDGRIRIFTSEFFASDQFQYFLNAADVAALPFSAILTSGSVITALGFGLPVVLPRLGCLPELVDARLGLLYDPTDPQGLEKALVEIRTRDLEAMGQAARQKARELDWDKIAGQLAALYRDDDDR